MDPPDLQAPDSSESTGSPFRGESLHHTMGIGGDEPGAAWLEEIIDRLEEDPDECWPAIESLSAVDEEIRAQVIEALAHYRERPGVRELFRLLEATRDASTRSAAAHVLTRADAPPDGEVADSAYGATGVAGPASVASTAGLPDILPDRGAQDTAISTGRRTFRISRSLVTAIDGDGRGTIVLSASDRGFRRTAAFRCDVRRGILDVVGEVEEEHACAGRMVDEWIDQADGDYAIDMPELAVRLLEGCGLLSGAELPDHVRAWLDATIGSVTTPAGLAATLPGPELEAIPDHELSRCVDRILDACPDWLDRSALTFELAEEIALREGCAVPDPIRDAGAYRYLFEHLLIGRLELYARMLLWMAWVWHAGGRPDLSRPAFVLAAQLSDEQYAVPSHPFTVTLTTRSLRAAQAVLLERETSGADE